ncbi:HBR294Wp [Eremothecium sinecaudum]|uniref:HBR294Wp n=1 Tax=Eremothecium sinecaudum TaxID=45286 RepID=A0A125RE22_9SACH|nr:HBR294Wp [Eremothecium sinecaudum]AMD19195.1 HBR294Wp [Eremothecium sinecaudum]
MSMRSSIDSPMIKSQHQTDIVLREGDPPSNGGGFKGKKPLLNRVTLGTKRIKKYRFIRKWLLPDVILGLILIVLNIPCYYFKPFERQFTINDISISHPFATQERVSDKGLAIYSLVIPIIGIIVISLVLSDPRHRYFMLYVSLLGLCMSYLSAMLVTNFAKNWFGHCRPDFLARCIPREGLQNDVLYTAQEACTTDNRSRLLDGFRSTPSGHTSLSLAGLGYLFLWVSGQLLTARTSVGSWRKAVSFVPLLGATYIGLSRTQDYRHHLLDVLLGAILGAWMAWWWYRRFFPALDSRLPFKPLLDDSAVDIDDDEVALPRADEEMAVHTIAQ